MSKCSLSALVMDINILNIRRSPCEFAGKNNICEAEFPFQMQRKENILHYTDFVHTYMNIY